MFIILLLVGCGIALGQIQHRKTLPPELYDWGYRTIAEGDSTVLKATDFGDSLANSHAKVTADTVVTSVIEMVNPVYWDIPISNFSVIAVDSVTSMGFMADTTAVRTDYLQYFSVTTANSPSSKKVILSQTFTPIILNPDSIAFDIWYDGTAASTDSGAIMVIIKDVNGVIFNTGWQTVLISSTWEHRAFVPITPTIFTKYRTYSCRVYMKTVSGKRWCFSPVRFK